MKSKIFVLICFYKLSFIDRFTNISFHKILHFFFQSFLFNYYIFWQILLKILFIEIYRKRKIFIKAERYLNYFIFFMCGTQIPKFIQSHICNWMTLYLQDLKYGNMNMSSQRSCFTQFLRTHFKIGILIYKLHVLYEENYQILSRH